MRSTVALIRDVSIGLLALLLVSTLVGSGSWIPLALTVAVDAGWILVMRRGAWKWTSLAETAAFLANGVLVIWRFSETLLWVAVAIVWLLVVAADRSRLYRRYPTGSPPLYQLRVFRHHIVLLGLIGSASLAIVALSVALTIEPTILAILLLAAFLVVGITRAVVESHDPPTSEEQ